MDFIIKHLKENLLLPSLLLLAKGKFHENLMTALIKINRLFGILKIVNNTSQNQNESEMPVTRTRFAEIY